MLCQTMSSECFEALAYFATGHIAYNDQLPEGLPAKDLLDFLIEKNYIKIIQINPNEMVSHHDNPGRTFYYAISPVGKEAYYLEKKMRDEHAKQKADNEASERATENRWRKDVRRSWIQFWLDAMFGLIGLIAGVVLEHFFSIIDLLMKIL